MQPFAMVNIKKRNVKRGLVIRHRDLANLTADNRYSKSVEGSWGMRQPLAAHFRIHYLKFIQYLFDLTHSLFQ